jgi:TatA/E family protein of Tat protein translocase
MFGSLGVPELLLIFVVILIVFGPRRIPEIGRTLGKAMGEFRKATDDLKSTIEREVRLEELKKIAPPTMSELTTPFESVARDLSTPFDLSRSEPVVAEAAPADETSDAGPAGELAYGAPAALASVSPAEADGAPQDGPEELRGTPRNPEEPA